MPDSRIERLCDLVGKMDGAFDSPSVYGTIAHRQWEKLREALLTDTVTGGKLRSQEDQPMPDVTISTVHCNRCSADIPTEHFRSFFFNHECPHAQESAGETESEDDLRRA